MSRSYKKSKDEHHDGYDDPLDIRYTNPKRIKQPHVPPKPDSIHWMPRQYSMIDPDWDTDD